MNKELLNSLVRKLRLGDMDSFHEFYELTKYEIFYNIFAILKDKSLSEDALQDTYVNFLNNIGKIKDDTSPMNFLYVSSRNIALDYYRKRKRLVNVEEKDLDLLAGHYEMKHQNNDLLDRVKEILKEREYEIFILYVINELTHSEIAKLLKRPLGTITWAYNNAIKKLRKELGDEYEI